MSTISTLIPTSASTGTGSTTTNPNGVQSLKPTDFINMMVTQLQNQDPLSPTSSQDLLSQMSQIGQLQSSTQLQATLTGLSLQSQIGSASSLIGKLINGVDANQKTVTGTVTSVSVNPATNGVTLNLDSGGTLPLSNVTKITAPPAATAAAAAA